MTPLVASFVALLVVGAVGFAAVAAIGLVRLPDCYSRAHATSKSDTLGTLLGLTAVGVAFGGGKPTFEAALAVVFVLSTGPTAAHAITAAAYERGTEPWTRDDDRGER